MPMKVTNRKKKPGVIGTTTNGSGGNFTDSAMDEFLGKKGLYRKPIAKDGSCLFRAVSEQVHNCQARHLDVRNKCIAFMRQNRGLFEEFVEGPFDHHLFKLQNPKEWAGQVEITALSQMYRKDFVVYQDINSPPTKVTDHGYKDKILLCYSNGNHYDIIYHNKFQENAAMCQTLLYEMLYNKVFMELDKKESTKKGKQKGLINVDKSRNSDKNIMEWVNGCMTDDTDMVENGGDNDGWTEVKSKARAKHERLAKPVEVDENKDPEETKAKVNSDQKYLWEVRRSVDPHFYRNISLEVWEEEKHLRQQQDMAVAVTLQFKNGDRCLVKLCPPNAPVEKSYTAIIKEDYTGSGAVSVYIPELKEKQNVPIQFVKPSENQQGPSYKELSGYYKKEETANGPVSEDGSKDESKNKKKRPPRSRRGPGKEDISRGRGRQRERYVNKRRFPKEDRIAKDEEEAKFIAEQIKLVELQEKDPKAFPALPVRSTPQISNSSPAADLLPSADLEGKVKIPTPALQREEKAQEKETAPTNVESTPAAFWSRLAKTKQINEAANTPNSPTTSLITTKPDNQPQQTLEAVPHKVEERINKQEEQECTSEDAEDEPVEEKVAVIEDDVECIRMKDNSASEIGNRQYQTAQLKPLPTDVKNSKTACKLFEVKIPQPAKLIPVKVSPSQPLQQPKFLQQSSEIEEVETPSSVVEFPDMVLKQELTEQVMEHKFIESEKEIIDSGLKEQEQIKEQLPETTPSTVNLQNKEDMFSHMENCSVSEDESTKLDKAKIGDSGVSSASPERKTVTFAETHKEIPVAQYGQKGILIVNGTNTSISAEEGYKTLNTEEYNSVSKDSTQDFASAPQEQTEKDLQSFPGANANEGVQSSSPTTQQQNQALMQFMIPGVQIPNGPSVDPSGADLPQDPQTLRYFFNLGYQYLSMLSQMNNQQLPYVYMYQGSMPDQMMQQSAQPVASLPQQQMYMQHQQLAYQHAGLQNYQPPFHVPQTNPDSTTQHERTSERTNPAPHQHQAPLQSQQQMPILHKQQAGHFQSQQPQQQSQFTQNWRPSPRMHYSNSSKPHVNHHGSVSQQRFQYHQNSAGNTRQVHYKENNKQNRKQGPKTRSNDILPSSHFNHPLGQNIAHNQATPSQPTTYFMPHDQNKGSGHEFYPGNNVMYNYHSRPPSGIPSHSAVPSRGLYN